jgi:hypothetical protein
VIYLCSDTELAKFTGAGRFGYFRHVLQAKDIPVGEVLAAHMKQARQANLKAKNEKWFESATQELITLLRDDYPILMSVLGALGEIV